MTDPPKYFMWGVYKRQKISYWILPLQNFALIKNLITLDLSPFLLT